MNVRDFMVRDVITVRPENTVKDVMSIFVEKKVGGVPITNNDGTLCGIVTDGDIIRAIKPLDRRIHDYFSFITYIAVEDRQVHLSEIINREIIKFAKTHGIITVQPEDDMEKVIDILSKHHFKKLPVVNGANRVVGVISRGDVIRNIQQRIVEEL